MFSSTELRKNASRFFLPAIFAAFPAGGKYYFPPLMMWNQGRGEQNAEQTLLSKIKNLISLFMMYASSNKNRQRNRGSVKKELIRSGSGKVASISTRDEAS